MTDLSEALTGPYFAVWTGYASLHDNLRGYLTTHGWVEQPPGRAATMWYAPGWQDESHALIVPSGVQPGSFEWRSVVRRLAGYEQKAVDDLLIDIATQYVDVTRLRAAGDEVRQGSIPLQAGVKLVGSARAMLRSIGTTARRPRAAINGKFSPLGDSIVGQARMAQTEDGSYIVPILMPIRPPSSDENEADTFVGMEIERMPVESSERRIMRMLAQAIAAASEIIVRPERSPRRGTDLLPFIAAGGSKELLAALHTILNEPTVTQLETHFSWAGGIQSPGGVAETVVLESEAAPRLESAARLLLPSERFPGQMYSGQIIAIMHRPGDDYGEIEVDTIHNNRRCRLRVHLQGEVFSKTYIWAHDERAILVEGEVERVRRRLTIENPRQVRPLDELFSTSAE
jgi:hypothetical protein